jgi:hypothetical protein
MGNPRASADHQQIIDLFWSMRVAGQTLCYFGSSGLE